MTLGNLMKLLYRDYIPAKHADRKRLASEIQGMEAKAALQPPAQRPALRADPGRDADNTASLMSTILVRYLMEVSLLCLAAGAFQHEIHATCACSWMGELLPK